MPILVYHLFFDVANDAHRQGMEAFKRELGVWTEAMKLCNMKFLAISTPVTNMAEVAKQFGGMRAEIFRIMSRQPIYKFDFDATRVDCIMNA